MDVFLFIHDLHAYERWVQRVVGVFRGNTDVARKFPHYDVITSSIFCAVEYIGIDDVTHFAGKDRDDLVGELAAREPCVDAETVIKTASC